MCSRIRLAPRNKSRGTSLRSIDGWCLNKSQGTRANCTLVVMVSGNDGATSASGSGARGPEERGVLSHKVTDAGRRSAGDRLDIVREAIIPIGGMELGHGQHMRQDIVRQVAEARL